MTELPKIGSELPNGTKVVAVRADNGDRVDGVVLALTGDYSFQPYVVWRININPESPGYLQCYSGDYSKDILEAAKNYAKR